MRILETDMGERKMDKKNQQDRMGKPSGAFYRAEDHLTIQLLPQKGNGGKPGKICLVCFRLSSVV